MKPPINKYHGKMTAYLDHNILDLFVKNTDLLFEAELKEKYQIIYSDETLKEIRRSGVDGSHFLEVLKNLNAMHLQILVTDRFEVTNQAILKETNPFDAFENYCANVEPIYLAMEKATAQTLLKFYGGRKESDFDEISNEQIESFDNLMNYMTDKFSEIKHLTPGIESSVSTITKDLQRSFREAIEQSTEMLQKNIGNEVDYSAVEMYRNHFKIGPKQLNNIEAPSVITKIWEIYKNLEGHENYSIEQFLGISRNLIYNREMFLHEKVTSTYNVLNVIGYYPDSKMKHERRFTAAMSDAGHASIGSFSDFIFSGDTAFIHKTRAAYEYLNVKTKVIEVIVNDD